MFAMCGLLTQKEAALYIGHKERGNINSSSTDYFLFVLFIEFFNAIVLVVHLDTTKDEDM